MNRATAMNDNTDLADCCCGPTRRGFLADMGMGFVGLALGAMLHRDGIVRADPTQRLESPQRPAPFPGSGQASHLADDARGRQPPREL